MASKKHNPFELFFQCFVQDFGGEVLPESTKGHVADYLFRDQNIVGELKTLTVDQTNDLRYVQSKKTMHKATNDNVSAYPTSPNVGLLRGRFPTRKIDRRARLQRGGSPAVYSSVTRLPLPRFHVWIYPV